ncbi:MAG: triose-phosphate isomerase [Labilithrix sp.]|nr:triose-phosphate isomerase [Labilithrix sp.]MCW5813507.1 triose-phosphate isomerase [Labilithrix sp.]
MNAARRPLIAGNWKMFKGSQAGIELAQEVIAFAKDLPKVDVVIAPPFTVLAAVASELEHSKVGLAAQNLYPKNEGAFTGEVSAPFLKDCGCTWVIVGHSERRQYFAETDAFVAEKAAAALGAGLLPIICVGETLQQREGGETLRVVKQQVDAFLDVIAQAKEAVAIAYEPVWAIGTGKTAGPAEAEEVHAAIREWLTKKSPELATKTRILYGGSVKADNAAALLGCPNVDGALVGGASLDAGSFSAIARAAQPSAAS